MFFNPFPNAIGMDINDLSIKVVQLNNISKRRRGPSYELVTARNTQLPHGLIVNGTLEKPEPVRKYISHLLKKRTGSEKPIKAPWVVASLPDNQGFLKLIKLDKEPGDIIEEDILIASKKHVPFEEDEYYLDWQIVPNHESDTEHTSVLLGSIPKNIADMYTYLLESLGMAVIALEIGALSSARAMITANKVYTGEARAILDIGATQSTITIFDHDHIQFNSSLSYSGEALTTSIAQKLSTSYDEAEMKKKAYGLEYTKNKSWPILAELTDQLVGQIEKTLDFYYSHFPNTNKITHITMCGGGSALKNLDKILSLKLKIPAKPGNVWKNLFSPKTINISNKKSLRFTKAIGLALRAADNPFFNNDTI
jgi:type IV pilus assembly protein PilM